MRNKHSWGAITFIVSLSLLAGGVVAAWTTEPNPTPLAVPPTTTLVQISPAAYDAIYNPTTTTTAAPPTTTHRPRPTTTTPRVSRGVPRTGDVWYALAMCETGGKMNQDATSRTGKYRGYFQFSMATWASVGGPGDPRDHDYETQKSYAQKLQARSGWGQWPHCSSKLGLR